MSERSSASRGSLPHGRLQAAGLGSIGVCSLAALGHIPIRTCVVCSTKRPKGSLLRAAVDIETERIVLDCSQRMKGRGAYVCPECLPRLRYNKRIQKVFGNKTKGFSEELQEQVSRND